jgi:hypothetical protein
MMAERCSASARSQTAKVPRNCTSTAVPVSSKNRSAVVA